MRWPVWVAGAALVRPVRAHSCGTLLIAGSFDRFVEAVCQPYYAATMGAPSLPPGRYFRMRMVGYFEGIASERGIAWRCSDSLSLRDFLRLESRERVPDHSWLSKTRGRLPHEVHERVFGWVLKLMGTAWSGANGSASTPRRGRPTPRCARWCAGRMAGTYREMLTRMAKGWCEFSAWLFMPLCFRWSTEGITSPSAAP